MSDSRPDGLPDDLREVADRLCEQRADASPLELDQIKTRARAQAQSARPSTGGMRARSRAITVVLTALLIGGTTAGGIAATSNNGSAANSQYRPGLGCGDKNHVHTGPPGNPDKTCKNG